MVTPSGEGREQYVGDVVCMLSKREYRPPPPAKVQELASEVSLCIAKVFVLYRSSSDSDCITNCSSRRKGGICHAEKLGCSMEARAHLLCMAAWYEYDTCFASMRKNR